MSIDVPLSSLIPRRNRMFIERLSTGWMYRHILPPNTSVRKRPPTAIVRAVGENVTNYFPGDQIILSANVGKTFSIGPRGETTWESIPPRFVIAVVSDGAQAERLPAHTFRNIPPADRVFTDELEVEE